MIQDLKKEGIINLVRGQNGFALRKRGPVYRQADKNRSFEII